MNINQIINKLYLLSNQDIVTKKHLKFGIDIPHSLGIHLKDLNDMASEIGKNKTLALELYNTKLYEARLLTSKIFPVSELTSDLMETWVHDFETWEICDNFCMGLFSKSSYAIEKIYLWSHRESEFQKRAAFATMASYCNAQKHALNDIYIDFLDLIYLATNDDRHFVKKAVNWALRSIGKRNIDLH